MVEEGDERVYRLASARAATDRIKRSSVMCNLGIFSAHVSALIQWQGICDLKPSRSSCADKCVYIPHIPMTSLTSLANLNF